MNTTIQRVSREMNTLKTKLSRRSLFALAAGASLALASVQPANAQTPTGTRIVPESVALGQPFNVEIHTESGTGDWNLSEQVPAGFTVEDISHGGRFVPGMQQVQWGPFPGAVNEPVSYRLVPAQLGLGTVIIPVGGPETGITQDPIQFPDTEGMVFPIQGPTQLNLTGAVFPAPTDPAPPGPTIITQPVSQRVALGSTTTVEVTATGREPLAYQWFRNGKAIPGATASSRILRDLHANDGGVFFVVIRDIDGHSTVSRPITIQVVDPNAPPPNPLITKHPKDRIVREGHHASFSVEAEGLAPLSYQWFHNGRKIEGADSPELVVRHVSLAHHGAYHAMVTDNRGYSSLTHGAVLWVQTPEPFTVVRNDHSYLRPVLNLTGSYSDRFATDDAEIVVDYVLTHNQLGRLSGAGTLSFTTADHSYTTDLHIHGTIRTVGHPEEAIQRVILTHRAEVLSSFEIHFTQTMEVDAAFYRMVGDVHGEARVGEEFYPIDLEGHHTELPPGRDGNWTLSVTPPVDQEVKGHAILQVQGDEFHYEVTRRPLPNQDLDVFHLRGSGPESRGSNLRLDADAGYQVIRMFGQAKGQHLNAIQPK